ncbi:hypothetical protein [Streptomyces noursei]|uniref:hypothetical protein n=1 Tax=Streptomyces noursei TaxID=1971 RepID=UPI0037F379F8
MSLINSASRASAHRMRAATGDPARSAHRLLAYWPTWPPTAHSAYWRRPDAHLDPRVRAGISMLAQTGEDALAPGLTRLADDLTPGRWHTRYAELLTLDTIDVGYRLPVSDV